MKTYQIAKQSVNIVPPKLASQIVDKTGHYNHVFPIKNQKFTTMQPKCPET